MVGPDHYRAREANWKRLTAPIAREQSELYNQKKVTTIVGLLSSHAESAELPELEKGLEDAKENTTASEFDAVTSNLWGIALRAYNDFRARRYRSIFSDASNGDNVGYLTGIGYSMVGHKTSTGRVATNLNHKEVVEANQAIAKERAYDTVFDMLQQHES